ncbi:MAG: peptidyl-tRNA hydrolase Pth2 [archaeon]
MDFEYKQAILLRKDLNLSKGKAVAQGAHASIDAFIKANRDPDSGAQEWLEEGMKKVVLEVADETELVFYFQKAKDFGLPASLIKDAGHTEIPAGTKTAVGIGPAKNDEIDKITGDLKLLK